MNEPFNGPSGPCKKLQSRDSSFWSDRLKVVCR